MLWLRFQPCHRRNKEKFFLRNRYIFVKNFSFLRWFLRWATKKGFNENKAFELFKPKLKTIQKKIIFLTQPELSQLKNFDIPKEKKYLEDNPKDINLKKEELEKEVLKEKAELKELEQKEKIEDGKIADFLQ